MTELLVDSKKTSKGTVNTYVGEQNEVWETIQGNCLFLLFFADVVPLILKNVKQQYDLEFLFRIEKIF